MSITPSTLSLLSVTNLIYSLVRLLCLQKLFPLYLHMLEHLLSRCFAKQKQESPHNIIYFCDLLWDRHSFLICLLLLADRTS